MKCYICCKNVARNSQCISCCLCNAQVHVKCTDFCLKTKCQNRNWFCQNCVNDNIAFSTIDDEEFEILTSGLDEELHILSKVCDKFNFEPFSKLERNKYNFDMNINADENFYASKSSKCSYYVDEKFNTNYMNIAEKKFSLIHFNCRSLPAHFKSVSSYLKSLAVQFLELLFLQVQLFLNLKHFQLYW